MPSFHTNLAAMAGLFALLAAAPAGAVIIDDFSDAQGPVIGFDATFQPGSMLGGERDAFASAGATFVASGGVATASDASISLNYDGADASPLTATYGLVGANPTERGLSDQFWL